MFKVFSMFAVLASALLTAGCASEVEVDLFQPELCNQINYTAIDPAIGDLYYVDPVNDEPFFCASDTLFRVSLPTGSQDTPNPNGPSVHYYCQSGLPSCTLTEGLQEVSEGGRSVVYEISKVNVGQLNPRYHKVYKYATRLGHSESGPK